MKTDFRSLLFGIFALLLVSNVLQADTILFEDFEDSTLAYTPNSADALGDIANENYYGRLAPDTALPPASIQFSNLQGSGYYGVHDTDNALGGGGGADPIELNWSVSTTDYENISLSWFIAEDDDGINNDWDTGSNFNIAVQLDGGGYTTIFAVEASEGATPGDFTNEAPAVDTNFDGIGDGAEITDVFTQFSAAIANAGTIDIRIQFNELDSGDEDFAFDNLHLEGDFVGVPEPGSAVLLVAAVIGLVIRRRRR